LTSKGKDISKYSHYKKEGEVLLLPGSYFEVKGIMTAGNGLIIIQLDELPLSFECIIGLKTNDQNEQEFLQIYNQFISKSLYRQSFPTLET